MTSQKELKKSNAKLVFEQLDYYNNIVFKYENRFLERVFGFSDFYDLDLLDIHYGPSSIIVKVCDMSDGNVFVRGIAIKDFIDWLEDLKLERFTNGEDDYGHG